MSVYLGREKVGIAIPAGGDSTQEVITPQQKQALSDAVNWRTGKNQSELQISDMIQELNNDYFITRQIEIQSIPHRGEWVRPNSWPDLDSLNLQMSGDDYIYMTYDANQSASALTLHIETTDKSDATLDIGHIENGTFIVDETHTIEHAVNYTQWMDEYSGYLVLRITGLIARCYNFKTTANEDGRIQDMKQVPILERISYLPHLTAFTASNYSWAPWTLQHEVIGNDVDSPLNSLAAAWFQCSQLQKIDVSHLHTKQVTTFSTAFNYCSELEEIDVSNFETDNVTTAATMFAESYALQKIKLWTSESPKLNATNSMFSGCASLKEIENLDKLDTAHVTTFSTMFGTCRSLEELDLSSFDTTSLTKIDAMFSNCVVLKTLNLSNWKTGNITNLGTTFNNCANLKFINFDGWEDVTKTTSTASMFYGCSSLQSIDISWLHLSNKCTSIYAMFSGCWSLKRLDIPNDWNLTGLSSGNNTANSMFNACYSLEEITGITNWTFRLTNSLASMFANNYSLKHLDVSGWDVSTVTSLASIFSQCNSLEELDLSNWNPANCTNLSSMFIGCNSLRTIGDISQWNTAKCTTMASMFQDCYSLQEFPPIQNWNKEKVTTLASMFSNCRTITNITLNNQTLTKCTTIVTMFRYCYGLETVEMKNWTLPALTATSPTSFLGDCWNLRDVDINLPIKLAHSYAGDRMLTHESIINILEGLPTITTARTLNLTATNLQRLSAEEKAIATSKGWTLAN